MASKYRKPGKTERRTQYSTRYAERTGQEAKQSSVPRPRRSQLRRDPSAETAVPLATRPKSLPSRPGRPTLTLMRSQEYRLLTARICELRHCQKVPFDRDPKQADRELLLPVNPMCLGQAVDSRLHKLIQPGRCNPLNSDSPVIDQS